MFYLFLKFFSTTISFPFILVKHEPTNIERTVKSTKEPSASESVEQPSEIQTFEDSTFEPSTKAFGIERTLAPETKTLDRRVINADYFYETLATYFTHQYFRLGEWRGYQLQQLVNIDAKLSSPCDYSACVNHLANVPTENHCEKYNETDTFRYWNYKRIINPYHWNRDERQHRSIKIWYGVQLQPDTFSASMFLTRPQLNHCWSKTHKEFLTGLRTNKCWWQLYLRWL